MNSPPMATFPVKATYQQKTKKMRGVQTRLPDIISSISSQEFSKEAELIKDTRRVLLESQGVKFYER